MRLAAVALLLSFFSTAAAGAGNAPARAIPGLDPDLRAALVTISAEDAELVEVFGQFHEQALVNVIFDEQVRLMRRVSFEGRGRLAEVLPRFLSATGLTGKAYNARTLLFFPDSPKKRWAYSEDNPSNRPPAPLPRRWTKRGWPHELEGATVGEAFATFAEHSGLRVRLDPAIDQAEKTDFRTDPINAQVALELLCLKLGLTYKREGGRRLLVYPATPEKMFEHDDPRTEGLTPADFQAPHER